MPQPPRSVKGIALVAVLGALTYLGVAAPVSSATTASSSNLLKGDTAALRHGLGAWAPLHSRLSRPSAGMLAIRVGSLSSTVGATTTYRRMPAAAPHRVYRAQVTMRSASASRKVRATLTFYNRHRKVISSVKGQTFADSRAHWGMTAPVIGLAPAGAAYVAVSAVISGAQVGETHYLTKPVLTVARATGRGVVGPLRTVGNRVYDARGPVVLKGIHRRGFELLGPVPITDNEMLQAKRWGATMVRLSVSSAYWDRLNCNYQSTYEAKLDQAVKTITSRGLIALIDLHTNTLLPCGGEVRQQLMADSRAPQFWREVAARYAGNPRVAFDLYNEPHWITDDIWLNGGWVYPTNGEAPFLAAGMQEMYDAVRSTGAKNLVIVTGNDWGNRLPDLRVTGTNIVYGLHIYTCPLTPEKCSSYGANPTPVLRRWVKQSARVPVMVTEFGWPSKDDGRYLATVIAFARPYRWGWVAFGWDGRTTGDFSLVATQSPAYQPTPSGIPVLDGMNFH